MSDDVEGITVSEESLDLAEFVDIADEQSRGASILDEPQDVDLRLVELSASFLDPDNILRTYSITADGFDPEAYDHSGNGEVATDGGQIGTTKSLEFAFSEYFGRHGSRPANLQTKQKIREFAQWCADNGIEFLDVGALAKGEKLVADGGVSAVFTRVCDLAIADGDVPEDGSGLDRVWKRTIPSSTRDRDWNVALNPNTESEQEVDDYPSEGDSSSIPVGAAVIHLGRTPAGVVRPQGGQVAVEDVSAEANRLEDDLLRDIESELIEMGEDIERTVPLVAADGGVEVDAASASDMDSAESEGPEAFEFVVEAMDQDDVSVTRDGDHYVVTKRGQDRGMVDTSGVVDLVNKHGLTIKDAYADVEHPALTLEVGK